MIACLVACSSSSSRPPPSTTGSGSDTSLAGSGEGGRAIGDATAIDSTRSDAPVIHAMRTDVPPTDPAKLDARGAEAASIDGRGAAPFDARGATDAPMRADASVDAGDRSTSQPPTGCPASFAAATGSCTRGASCAYREGTCSCTRAAWCGGAAPSGEFLNQPPVWQCIPMVKADGCPGSMPAAGGRCKREGQRCDYTCSCVAAAVCTDGAWKLERGPCKPSAPPRGPPE